MSMSEEARRRKNDYLREWREKNREHHRAYQKRWRIKNADKVQASQDKYWEKKVREDTEKTYLLQEID
jgi:ferric-dicitrate binding protein FerR (iron transport regulator)